jgi:hypothetical protein
MMERKMAAMVLAAISIAFVMWIEPPLGGHHWK